jgi:hypothetical protein
MSIASTSTRLAITLFNTLAEILALYWFYCAMTMSRRRANID